MAERAKNERAGFLEPLERLIQSCKALELAWSFCLMLRSAKGEGRLKSFRLGRGMVVDLGNLSLMPMEYISLY